MIDGDSFYFEVIYFNVFQKFFSHLDLQTFKNMFLPALMNKL